MASLSFHIRIEMADGTTQEVDTIPFDIIRWERKEKKSFAAGDPTIESLLWLAWCAARRQHVTEIKLFDDWAADVLGFDTTDPNENTETAGTKDGQVDPTQMVG